MSEKKCPYCKVKIDENALKCNHCHSDLSEKSCEKDGSLFISSDNMFFFKFLFSLIASFFAYTGFHYFDFLSKKEMINEVYSKAQEINKLKDELSANKTSLNSNSIHINNLFGDYVYRIASIEGIKIFNNHRFVESFFNKNMNNIDMRVGLDFNSNLNKKEISLVLIYFKKGEGFNYRINEMKEEYDYSYRFGVLSDFDYSIIILKKDGSYMYGDFEYKLTLEEKEKLATIKKDK